VRYGIDELKSNIETILVVLKAHRTPLGGAYCSLLPRAFLYFARSLTRSFSPADNARATLSAMLAEPLRCLPRPFLGLASQPLNSHPPPSGPSSHVAPIPWQARFNGVGTGSSSTASAPALGGEPHAPLVELAFDVVEEGLSDPATFLRELDAAAAELAPPPPPPPLGVAAPLDVYNIEPTGSSGSATAPLAQDGTAPLFAALDPGGTGAVEWQTLQSSMGLDDLLYS